MALTAKSRTFNGLTIGAGTDIKVISESGLEGLGGVRSGDQAVPRGHGSIPGGNFVEPKTIVLELMVVGSDVAGTLRTVLSAFSVSEDPYLPYVFNNGDGDFFIRCRPIRCQISRNAETGVGNRMPVKVALQAADPFVYEAEVTDTLTAEVDGAGVIQPDSAVINNTGDLPAAVELVVTNVALVISGTPVPMLEWTIENATSGVTVHIDYSTLPANLPQGESWEMVAGAQNPYRGVGEGWLTNGGFDGSQIPGWVIPREVLVLLPGNNTINFTVVNPGGSGFDPGGSATLTVTARETYP